MSDGISDAEREGRRNIDRWKESAINQLLSTFTKEQLVGELCRREGVKEIVVSLEDYAYISHGRKSSIKVDGAARILVVID